MRRGRFVRKLKIIFLAVNSVFTKVDTNVKMHLYNPIAVERL